LVPIEDGNVAFRSILLGIGTRRMPPDAPLPAEDIDLILRWMCAGAQDN
jgi:hypothetical protein